MRHLLLVELNADNPLKKKPFNFMQCGKGSQKRLRENMTVKKEAKYLVFTDFI